MWCTIRCSAVDGIELRGRCRDPESDDNKCNGAKSVDSDLVRSNSPSCIAFNRVFLGGLSDSLEVVAGEVKLRVPDPYMLQHSFETHGV